MLSLCPSPVLPLSTKWVSSHFHSQGPPCARCGNVASPVTQLNEAVLLSPLCSAGEEGLVPSSLLAKEGFVPSSYGHGPAREA